MRFARRWRELDEELQSHRRMAAADGRAEPWGDRVAEGTRDQWAWVWLDDLLRDLRYGARGLRLRPGFALVAVLTLGLGMGAAATMFSLVNGVLLRPLPFPQPQRLVATNQYYSKGALAFLRGASHSLDLAGYSDDQDFNLAGDGADPAQTWTGSAVSANLFRVLGVAPARGRTLTAGDDAPGQGREVVISDALWRQRFHADPRAVGQTVIVDGRERAVVGVMPAQFRFPDADTRLWVPLDLDPAARGDYWAGTFMQLIGRLRPGANRAAAEAEWTGLQPRLRAAYGWPMPPDSFRGAELVPLREMVVGDVGSWLWLLFGAVGLLLLIACVNVANLVRARAATREREMRLRAALGAGRGRLLRQLAAEGLLLSAVGAALGAALSYFGLPLLKLILPADLPRLAEVTLDGRVLALVAAIAAVVGIAVGLLPAWGQERPRRARRAARLVVIEVALSAMLVVAAGLTARALQRLTVADPGFRAAGVVTARLAPDPAQCAPAARCLALYGTLLDRLRSLPGVADAAAVNGLPMGGVVEAVTFQAEGHVLPQGTRHPLALGTIVFPGYFRALGIPLLRGRSFQASDQAPGAPGVVILGRAAAARLWPGQDPLGRHFKADGEHAWRTVVGVVGDVSAGPRSSPAPAWIYDGVYSPYGQPMLACAPCSTPPTALTAILRLAPGAALPAAALRRAVAAVSPGIAVSQVESLQDWMGASRALPRSSFWLFALAAGLALALGAIGLYGVMAYEVAARTREIGVRMALGAGRREVLAQVAGRSLRLALLGIAAGLGGALFAMRLLASLLFGVSSTDPVVYVAVALLWFGVALLASAVPARRALRVDPVTALRCE